MSKSIQRSPAQRPSTAYIWALAALVLFILVVPRFLDEYRLHVLIMVLVYGALAISWDILGRTGQLSLAHAGLFGLGAYASAVLTTKLGVPQLLSIALAGAVCALVAAGLGAITLRLRATYFSIATLAFAEVMKTVALRMGRITGGPIGISVPMLFGGSRIAAVYMAGFILLLVVLTSIYIERGRHHFAFSAIRTKGDLASVFGVDVVKNKIGAFMVSAGLTGLVGGFYIGYISYTVPHEAFDLGISVSALVMSIFGGLGSTVGPLVGAVILKMIEEYLRVTVKYGYMIAYGAILVAVILFMPYGLVGVARKWLSSRLGASQNGSEG